MNEALEHFVDCCYEDGHTEKEIISEILKHEKNYGNLLVVEIDYFDETFDIVGFFPKNKYHFCDYSSSSFYIINKDLSDCKCGVNSNEFSKEEILEDIENEFENLDNLDVVFNDKFLKSLKKYNYDTLCVLADGGLF